MKLLYTSVMSFAAGCVITFAIWMWYHKSHPIVLKEITPAKTEWKQNTTNMTFGELKKCIESPIQIQCKTTGNALQISAEDDCKKATAIWQIVNTAPMNIYQLNAGFSRGDKWFISPAYYRRVGICYIGGGVMLNNKIFSGLFIGAQYSH